MDRTTVLARVLASGLVTAGVAAIFLWLWPGDAEVTALHAVLVALSAITGAAVLVSVWRK